ncbi:MULTISPECIES: patatin-like phospholipase family protein [Shewanella]|uniref:Patatin-like phospholipase family protein n=1 Tax=Shewanella fidelis TaxID=173509 RepID=A0AAW8NQS3_9GAMM|nr:MULTISPECIES: patatin-like phospholipase family protein [Shewanella]MDR8525262.1 patatin-like phospholipase family protein [Shewanella fidelis]MDW4814089.1 patatin-like phospholipase family protein [Shewanella fidelis]MDW4818251.1 patatin-like phospholipase family protein [Shewanella fidelis]MDW4822378.1 patatin-like phospholipase family protein [Shewanella fidelis]MDW4826516.1 patatin-like phospholipase family protein [Shewanella fidelis]
MSSLRFIAGPKAYKTLSENEFKPELFTQLLAASGGPKWIGIAGLDRYLFSEFFKDLNHQLHTLGASSGAWRLACLAQKNPANAYDRLEQLYIGQRYDTKPTASQISANVAGIICGILGSNGAAEIVDNQHINSHFIACQARHINRAGGRLSLATGLATAAMTNLISRKSIAWHFRRCVFAANKQESAFAGLNDLPSRYYDLSHANIHQVLLATGSIPLVLAPVTQIDGAPQGHYYDGGITDYHFDLPLTQSKGLTLYPHFYPHMAPGWFDKSLSRRFAKQNYDNALILAPSDAYLQALPYGKLPDREDFKQLDSDTRIKYWRQSASMSQVLADDLASVINRNTLLERLEIL